ncbi:DUF1330 domain-containing protein [Trujillonella endophytica]|uniref:Uncharacterized conserved protein, DUF1330 family n=1 Tax=Trujillonella endophytica TaxID=673521 RepID=A0A1H8VQR1_9ACTN|nr:DUF1330 domain-containing protein [Trujillella endophytica]SEP17623.1 Uncharacterized conserved protein, DUF1330 family [Trujillella endophytica]
MPKGYVVVTETIHDQQGIDAYNRAAAPSLMASGARVLVVDRDPEVLEGDWPATQTVVLEFESVEAARAWYSSDSYQEAAALRRAAADCRLVLLAGFTPSGPR